MSVNNAHPFIQLPLVGAHNGTLEHQHLSKLEGHDKFEVDSEALIYHLSKKGMDGIADVAGAYALTLYNQDENCMYFIRNSRRPLYYTRSNDKDCFYWASEEWMLIVGLKKATVNHGEVKEFKADTLYRLDLKKEGFLFRNNEMEVVKELKGFTPPPPQYGVHTRNGGAIIGTNHNPFVNGHGGGNSGRTSSGLTKLELRELQRWQGKTVEFYVDYERKGPSGLSYLTCSFATGEQLELRMYSTNNHMHTQWRSAIGSMTGKIRKIVSHREFGKQEVYGLIDLRSIEKTFFPPVQEQKSNVVHIGSGKVGIHTFPTYSGNVSLIEWMKVTRCGCAWCKQDPLPIDASKLVWINKTEFMCVDCSNNPDLKDYLKEMKK